MSKATAGCMVHNTGAAAAGIAAAAAAVFSVIFSEWILGQTYPWCATRQLAEWFTSSSNSSSQTRQAFTTAGGPILFSVILSGRFHGQTYFWYVLANQAAVVASAACASCRMRPSAGVDHPLSYAPLQLLWFDVSNHNVLAHTSP
jgi:hypothetical protein